MRWTLVIISYANIHSESVTFRFVPDGCELKYENGPRTIVMEKKGWEEKNPEVTAEVFQDSNDRWQVALVPKS